MIMAAGLGTRMGALTADRPKPLLKAGGRALIDHALDRAAEGGAERCVVNLHYRAEMLRAHLAGRADIDFSDETEALLETGGGVRKALPLLGPAPFFVLNSDAVWTGAAPLTALAAAWLEGEMDALLLLVPAEDARGYTRSGDFFIEDGAPVRRGTRPSAPYVYTGAQIIRAEAFVDTPEGPFSTNLVWDRLLAAGRVRAVVHEGAWVDVGTPEGLTEADRAIASA
jgi:MurNAc alpha-1-phosphate uridylyltransferase